MAVNTDQFCGRDARGIRDFAQTYCSIARGDLDPDQASRCAACADLDRTDRRRAGDGFEPLDLTLC